MASMLEKVWQLQVVGTLSREALCLTLASAGLSSKRWVGTWDSWGSAGFHAQPLHPRDFQRQHFFPLSEVSSLELGSPAHDRHKEEGVLTCPQMGYGRGKHPTSSSISMGHRPQYHSTPPHVVTETLNSFLFAFLPG